MRKTYQEKLRPTRAQERELEGVLWRCRTPYNAALEQRISPYRQRGVSPSRYQQEAELKDLRAKLPEYGAIHSHVLKDVLARLDKTSQAFFRRAANGEKPGFPRFQGRNHYHSYTFKEYDNGARLDNGYLVLSKIGRIAVRWSRPIEGTPKTVTISREADGWYVTVSCANVPMAPLPETGWETGIVVGVKVFVITAPGNAVENPRHSRRARRTLAQCQCRVSTRVKDSHRRRKAISVLAKAPQPVRRQRADFQHQTGLALVGHYDVIFVEAIQAANLSRRPASLPDGKAAMSATGPAARPVSTRVFRTPDGDRISRSALSRQRAPGSEWKRSTRRIHRRIVQAVGHGYRRAFPGVPTSVRTVG